MPLQSVSYKISQHFDFPAAVVFAWATDYQPSDIGRQGLNGRRKITPVCNDTLILDDTTVLPDGKRVTKKKLVRVYPERLAWTNTHLAGPNKHSQFLYEVVGEGKRACRLEFTGLQVSDYEKPLAKRELAALSKKLAANTAAIWRNLAKAMAAERG